MCFGLLLFVDMSQMSCLVGAFVENNAMGYVFVAIQFVHID